MARGEPARHIGVGESGVLCGSNSWAAITRAADCSRCNARMDAVLGLLLDVAEGKAGRGEAAALCRRIGVSRADEAVTGGESTTE
jgi:hypothetical protein